jgi:cell shape-determining protein MreC
MFQTNTPLVVMFLVIWKILLDLFYLLKRSKTRSLYLRNDSLFERVDQLTKEVTSLKNTIIDRKHEETIKYCQEIIDRSWEHLHEQERVEKETIMIMEEKKVEVKMLSEVKDPLLDL